MDGVEIRESEASDAGAIERLYPLAFPDEDLSDLVRGLLAEPSAVLSLVAARGEALVGHVAFTWCGVQGSEARVALLGPLAVAPTEQRRGVGSALAREGMRRMGEAGCSRVFVLGDPGYYARFGFETERRVTPPYPLPKDWTEAWRSLGVGGAEAAAPSGALIAPSVWRRRALWSA